MPATTGRRGSVAVGNSGQLLHSDNRLIPREIPASFISPSEVASGAGADFREAR